MCDDAGDVVEREQSSVVFPGRTCGIHFRSQRRQQLLSAVRKGPRRREEEGAVGEEAGTDQSYFV